MGSHTKENIKVKEQGVDHLLECIQEYQSFLVFEYLGLDSENISALRRNFRNSDSRFMVQKNNVLNRALQKMNLGKEIKLSGPNAILLTKNQLKPFQDIVKLSKDKEFIKLKLAYFDKELIEDENLRLLSTLSSKEDMIAKVARMILMPLYKFANVVKKIPK